MLNSLYEQLFNLGLSESQVILYKRVSKHKKLYSLRQHDGMVTSPVPTALSVRFPPFTILCDTQGVVVSRCVLCQRTSQWISQDIFLVQKIFLCNCLLFPEYEHAIKMDRNEFFWQLFYLPFNCFEIRHFAS